MGVVVLSESCVSTIMRGTVDSAGDVNSITVAVSVINMVMELLFADGQPESRRKMVVEVRILVEVDNMANLVIRREHHATN